MAEVQRARIAPARKMTPKELALFERWIIENVSASIVPGDVENDEALIYNLVHLLRGDALRYLYKQAQNAELESWGLMQPVSEDES